MGLSSKITKLRSPPVSPSYLKQVWDYLEQGLVFTVYRKEKKDIHNRKESEREREMQRGET